jgi:DNA repair photolyase
MADSKHFRDLAARMFSLAIATRDEAFARRLAFRASDYLDRAMALQTVKGSGAEP